MIGLGSMIMTSFVPPALPVVSSVSKANTRTQGGILLTITGSYFTGATGATIGGTALTSFVAVNATTVQGITPAKAAGAHDVAVTTNVGTGTLTAGVKCVNPSSIFGASLKRWYSETYSAGAWTDASGTFNTTQATAGKQPSATTLAATTDRPATHVALLFDGVDDGLKAGTAADIFTTAGTVAAIIAADVTQGLNANVFAKNYAGEDVIFAVSRTGFANKASFGCGGSTGTQLAVSAGSVNDNAVRRLISTLSFAGTSRLYVNGTVETDTGAGTPVGGSADFNSIGCAMSNSEAITDYHYAGKVAEVVVADIEASAQQRTELDAYLRDCAGAAS